MTWSAPQGCPQASDALARVQALLGSEVAAARQQPLEARAVVTALESGRFRLDLEMHQGSEIGARTIEADSCQEAAQAGALVIALTIDPKLLERRGSQPASAPDSQRDVPGQPPPAPVSPPPPRASPQPLVRSSSSDATRVAESAPRRSALRLGPGLSLLGDAGSLPGIGAGLELGAHARWRWLRSELSFVWLPSRRGLAQGTAEVGGSVQLFAAVARGCALTGRAAWTGGACGAFELGRMHAAAFGALVNGSGDISWVAPGFGLFGGYAISSGLSLRARIEGFIPLDRSEFIVENVGPVHEPASLVGRLSLGVDADFW